MCVCVCVRVWVYASALSGLCVLLSSFQSSCLSDPFEEDAQQCEISLCAHNVLMMDCAWVVLLGRPMCSTDASVL